jgi:hypothetical protein
MVMAGKMEGREEGRMKLVQINGSDMSFSVVGFFERGCWGRGEGRILLRLQLGIEMCDVTWRCERENIDCIIPTSTSHLAFGF